MHRSSSRRWRERCRFGGALFAPTRPKHDGLFDRWKLRCAMVNESAVITTEVAVNMTGSSTENISKPGDQYLRASSIAEIVPDVDTERDAGNVAAQRIVEHPADVPARRRDGEHQAGRQHQPWKVVRNVEPAIGAGVACICISYDTKAHRPTSARRSKIKLRGASPIAPAVQPPGSRSRTRRRSRAGCSAAPRFWRRPPIRNSNRGAPIDGIVVRQAANGRRVPAQ